MRNIKLLIKSLKSGRNRCSGEFRVVAYILMRLNDDITDLLIDRFENEIGKGEGK